MEPTFSQGRGSRNNLDQLHCDSGLSCLVVLESQFLEDLLGVLGSVLHCVHSSGLLGSSVVKEADPEVGSEVQFIKGRVASVLIRELLIVQLSEGHGLQESLSGHQLHLPDLI